MTGTTSHALGPPEEVMQEIDPNFDEKDAGFRVQQIVIEAPAAAHHA